MKNEERRTKNEEDSMPGWLFEVSALDPRMLLLSVGGVAVVACAACAGPALRAARIDPVRALRNE